MSEWISVEDALPINSPNDDWDSPFHEEEIKVLISGEQEKTAIFWCCWEDSYDDSDLFIKEFDQENVTHWIPPK